MAIHVLLFFNYVSFIAYQHLKKIIQKQLGLLKQHNIQNNFNNPITCKVNLPTGDRVFHSEGHRFTSSTFR